MGAIHRGLRWWILAALVFPATAFAAKDAAPTSVSGRKPSGDHSNVLVTVNGVPITENRLALYRLINGLPNDPQPGARKKLVANVVESELMRQFLIDRRANADPKRLASAVEAVKEQLRRRHVDPEQALRSLGYSDADLRRQLLLPLAWERHLDRVLTQRAIRDEFEKHRPEFDGTEVRASQIFIKLVPGEAQPKAKEAEKKLAGLRGEIAAGKLSFADAARRFSQAPSASQGGDVGFFPFRGKMPAEVARVAFSLKLGQMSQPFRTVFGVHLYKVTDIRPGNLSLEDVRGLVIRRLSRELWDQLAGQARSKATIDWRSASP